MHVHGHQHKIQITKMKSSLSHYALTLRLPHANTDPQQAIKKALGWLSENGLQLTKCT